ncbi:MAG: hypothetical protein AB7T06_15480 [Kofleriaceae bacterium]
MRHLVWISLILVACGGPSRHAHSVHLSNVSSANYKCGSDAVRNGELTADGEPIRFWRPCWEPAVRARYRVHLDAGDRAKLARVEATQCIGLAPGALERSPFAHPDTIEEIVPHRSGESIRGAHVVFRPIPGLTESWMRRAITCHRARWRALGMPADYLRGDPTLVDGARIHVSEQDHRVVVLIDSGEEEVAQRALARAESLVAETVASH